jgi:hypothetical protein
MDLKQYPEKLGMLGSYFDARILHFPVLAALASVRTYADESLKATMKAAGMSELPPEISLPRVT